MKKRTAILIDGEWFRIALENELRGQLLHGVTAEIIYRNALKGVVEDEEVHRIFYYDCEPHGGKTTNPISRKTVDCTSPQKVSARSRFFAELGRMPLVALRRGVVKPRNWSVKRSFFEKIIRAGSAIPLGADDVRLTMTQKGVDMRIGIDVATLALKQQVERIILISGDTDMIPAMKLARREGVQVIVVEFAGRKLRPEMVEDADILRMISASVEAA